MATEGAGMSCIDHGRTRSLHPEGYALVGWPGRAATSTGLHRLIYAQHNSTSLEAMVGKVVRHTCENPRCINPEHLLLGTRADNNRDRAERGRSAKSVPSRQRLSTADCAAIRARYDPARIGIRAPNGVSQLARDYGVDTNVIYKVLRGTYPK